MTVKPQDVRETSFEEQASFLSIAMRKMVETLLPPIQKIVGGQNGPPIYAVAQLKSISFDVEIGMGSTELGGRVLARTKEESTTILRAEPVFTIGTAEVKETEDGSK